MPESPTLFPRTCTMDEMLRSERAKRLGIVNVPTPEHLLALQQLAWVIFVPLRAAMGGAITISSGYRSAALNAQTPGASATSQHSRGEALDLVPHASVTAFTTREMFHFIRTRLPFDQLIYEHGTRAAPQWVHVSYAVGRRGRAEVLRATGGTDGQPPYVPWTTEWGVAP